MHLYTSYDYMIKHWWIILYVFICSLSIDSIFPKQQVETLNPPSISMYDSQLASDSIKSAIGMPTQQQQLAQEANNSSKGSAPVSVGSSSAGLPQSNHSGPAMVPVGAPQPQRQNRQQRSKVPPPSTKVSVLYCWKGKYICANLHIWKSRVFVLAWIRWWLHQSA